MAGRKSVLDENLRKLVMERCWLELYTYLCDKKINRKEKVKFAVVLAAKSVPQEVKADLKVSGIIVSFSDGTKVEM